MGHFASCGHDTVDAVPKLGARLKMVHLKDVEASGGEVNVLLGRGISRISDGNDRNCIGRISPAWSRSNTKKRVMLTAT